MEDKTNWSSPVTQDLEAREIPYRLFFHAGPVHSLEQAAQERGQRPEQVVRSILFRLSEEEFVMVLVGGPKRISWQALREYLGVSRMTMASEAEVLEITGYPLGAVAPFGLPAPVRILVDSSVEAEEELSMGSGVRGVAVLLKSKELLQALQTVERGVFVENSS